MVEVIGSSPIEPTCANAIECEMFYGYVVRSIPRGSFYIGHTYNIERRLVEHNTGQSKYTRNRGPWELVFRKEFPTRSEAMRWEADLKARKSHEAVEKLVRSLGKRSVG